MTGAADRQDTLDDQLVGELPALRAYLRRLVGAGASRSEVEDLSQEVIARALRYRAAFDPQRTLGPWLRATALRVFLDLRERRSRAPEQLDERGANLATSAPHVSERTCQREQVELALAKLSAVERDIVVRFHARSESVREIAAALALPEGTVKSHLHRARRKLGAGGTP